MARQKRVTIEEIAKQARVSPGAVSVALSGRRSTIGVSESTRVRVKALARRLNFQPNIHARGLASGKSFLLGFLCKDSYAVQILEVMRGIQDVVHENDYALLTFNHGQTCRDEEVHLKRCLGKNIAGIILMPALGLDGTTNAKFIREIHKSGVAVTQLFRRVISSVPTIVADDREGGRTATRHLISLGHQRIVHVTNEKYHDDGASGASGAYVDVRLRWEGYEEAMAAERLRTMVVTYPSVWGGLEYIRAGESLAKEILAMPVHPTAVFAYCDFIAMGLIRGFYKAGVRVPEDISVIGFDDSEGAITCFPALTTMRLPLREMGREAARLSLSQLGDGQKKDVVFKPEVAIRESTGRVPQAKAELPQSVS